MHSEIDYAYEIWKLLKLLPENEATTKKLSTLSFEIRGNTIKAWNSYLDIKNDLCVLLCIIRTIKKLLAPKQFLSQPQKNYSEIFEEKQGLTFLINNLLTVTESPVSESLYIYTILVKYLFKAINAVLNE